MKGLESGEFLFVLCSDFDMINKSEVQEHRQEGSDSAILKMRSFNNSSFNVKLLTIQKKISLHCLSSSFVLDFS